MLISVTNRRTTFYKVVYTCHSKDSAIELITVLRGLHVTPALYIRQSDMITCYVPFEFVRLLQACHRPCQAHTVRYFELGGNEDIAMDINVDID